MSEVEPNGKAIQIAVLQDQMKGVRDDVAKIKDNHLPHIYDRLGDIEKKIAYYTGGAAVIGVIANVIISAIAK